MFKQIKKKPLRKRRNSSDSDDASDTETEKVEIPSVNEVKEMQKLRKRTHGVSAEELSVRKEFVEKELIDPDDPFKQKTGGFVDMKSMKKSRITAADLEHIHGTSFAAETNTRDEDADMLKYVEIELLKKKGVVEEKQEQKRIRNPEDHLYELPENIAKLVPEKDRTEDMLSNQMLSGIPEIDLGIGVKIRNIEATEEAKARLLEEQRRKKDRTVDFVPTNVAVNFVQHNRFSSDQRQICPNTGHKLMKAPEAPKPEPVRVGDVRPASDLIESGPNVSKKKKGGEKSTDDFHFEKFKKQMRR